MTSQHLLVFIHGWSCRSSDWDATIAHLTPQLKAVYQPLAPALAGHWGAEAETPENWSMSALARALIAKLPLAPGQPLTLVGHSMGGCVALELAAQLTRQVKSVILVDTFGLPYGDMDAATIASIEQPFEEDFIAAMHSLVDNTTVPQLNADTRDWIKTRMASAAPALMLPIWHQLLRWSPDRAFAQIQCPIHALNGEHIAPVAQARCAPYVLSDIIPKSHHFPQFEQPALFSQRLNRLLS